MRVNGQNAYVLHTRPYSESSLLVDVFSREYGRTTVLAKGARRLKSKQRPYIRCFLDLHIGWSGKGELPVLTGTELVSNFVLLRGTRLFCGLYLNELISKLLQKGDPHERLFDHYAHSICALRTHEDLDQVVRAFEKSLLKEIGYAMILHHEAESATPIDPAQTYHYVPGFGSVNASNPVARNSHNSLPIKGSTLLALHANHALSGREKREGKLLLRMLLDNCLDGKKLNSRRLLTSVNLRNKKSLQALPASPH
ncbi:MAG: DNA repair protein RecO [Arenicellales bacterium WSBS_2016_MAG_OTU3]